MDSVKRYRDPVTGDALTVGEYLSWRVQGIIRNWWMLAIITAITVLVMVLGSVWTETPTTIWNYAASYLALLIEGTVGIAMFSQTRRDAVKIRKIEAIAGELRIALERQAALIEAHEEHYGKPILTEAER